MLWKLNMEQALASSFDSAVGKSVENEQNQHFNNILDTSVMVDPRKSAYFKPRPEEYDIEE